MFRGKLNQFQAAATILVANKIFADYIAAREQTPVEPESFVEYWVADNLIDTSPQMNSWIWKHFLKRLLTYRGNK